MDRKAKGLLAFGQRIGAGMSREAPCVVAVIFFLLALAGFLAMLFAKTAW